MSRGCRKYASRVWWFPLVRAWVKYGYRDRGDGRPKGHAYLCVHCGFWHFTGRNRRGLVHATPSALRARARRRAA